MNRLNVTTKRLLDRPDDVDDGVTAPLDEQEQLELLKSMEMDMANSNEQFRFAFAALACLETPIFIVLPYCHNHGNKPLAYMSLTVLLVCAYITYKVKVDDKAPKKYLLPMASVLAVLILVQAYLKHAPWVGYDYLWVIPAFTCFTTMVIRHWISESSSDLHKLKGMTYKLKGA
ncbi:hypothetical protein B0I72DRAFT_160269 [Yarrowia lipolytica]|uniref:Uncharacterized protein n=1 Tax=Yarrowia lipolytica TaxID=4952 RepID=A0A371BZ04_YARLL|nr:hypothetical protein BKA91DRAFT_152288 [Yarrowia lipolytica]KAE8169931.1 hypothetical protein BKA90DRAFT_154853 [Yarrowia lipolytica]RDW23264.1 hypothetical protein B0I71DRAFT_149195 [Yarrowia lipolytica]RDW30886.1 hypothetical protein B0I72DRAFT_160269 [Yarrowia lipolytica]RDW36363.1 hypothetical protein B0I73DRAFT_162096 [Yarrowia lipolytica]